MRWRGFRFSVTCLIGAIVCALVLDARAASVEEVDRAIAKAKTWLYDQQELGTWETEAAPDQEESKQSIAGGQWGGRTALATYALLAAGESHQDPRLEKALEFLKKADLIGTYAIGMRCQVWLFMPTAPDTRAVMSRDLKKLLVMVKTLESSRGMYDYVASGTKGPYSHSRSQYGVLGVWAAEQMKLEVPHTYWEMVEKAWIAHQDRSGGWTYEHPKETKHPLTPGMTAAGVATLFITQDFLHADEGVACKGNVTNDAIDKGIKWIAKNFDKVATDEKYDRDFPYPTLYAIERIGVASGHKYIGEHDWYEKGAAWLVKEQRSNGSWSEGSGAKNFGPFSDTSFAMLFLARGRAPVVMNKLDYGATGSEKSPANWNQRPRDVANLTRWIGKATERDLNWQIVPLLAPVDDLLDAPILYISGNQVLSFSDEHKAKIKTYIERGGLVLGNADCGQAGFANSFRKLGTELFPHYEFRELPAQHPIFRGQQFQASKWRTKPSVLAMSNGARELMILVPTADPAKAWQTQLLNRNDLFELPTNIFLYAIDKQNLRKKGETYWVDADEKIKTSHAVTVARLQYDGNWDPEPGGWVRLANLMRNRHQVELKVEPVKLGDGKLNDVKVAYLTGTTPIKLDDAARKDLKQFIESGGTLLIDAAGGASEFAKAIESELAAALPEAKLQVLPQDHPLYSATGKKIVAIEYRPFTLASLGKLTTPHLQAGKIKDRAAIIYSREDLSVGLVGQPVDGILGYSPASATDLVISTILYASPGGKKADGEEKKPTTRKTK